MTKRQSIAEPMEDVAFANPKVQDPKKIKRSHEVAVEATHENDIYEIKSDFLKKSVFEVYYMEVRARAEMTRYILEYVGVNYRNRAPVEWPKGKKDTMFGFLPQLVHTKPDGSKFELSETKAISKYVAILFGLWGSTLEEEATLDMLNDAISDNIYAIMLEEVWTKGDMQELSAFERFVSKAKICLDGIERFLVKNGTNGYFLGTKSTLPDFTLFSWLDCFFTDYTESAKKHFSAESYPGIFKLYQRLNGHPRIRAYIDGGRWKCKSSSHVLSMNATGFWAKDGAKLKEFYSETLGLNCRVDVEPAPGHRYIEFELPHSKTVFTITVVGDDCAGDYKRISPADSVAFSVHDVFEVHAMLAKKGIEFTHGPSDEGWACIGEFKDPEGNIVSLTSASKLGMGSV